ncbi:hypothetical protein BB560_004521, partial [Smittium megazygosporum]
MIVVCIFIGLIQYIFFLLLLTKVSRSVTENLRFRSISNDSESQTAISGLGRRIGQLDARQTENAECQDTEPDQSPHPTATRLVLPSSSSK